MRTFALLTMLVLCASAMPLAFVGTAQEPAPPTAAIESFEHAATVTLSITALKWGRVTDWDAVRAKAKQAMEDYRAAVIERIELPSRGLPVGNEKFELLGYGYPTYFIADSVWDIADATTITDAQKARALEDAGKWALATYFIARECGASHATLVDAWNRGHEEAEYTTVRVKVIDWTKEE